MTTSSLPQKIKFFYDELMTSQNQVIQYIIDQSKHYLAIQKIILFGSRARGDAKEKSDYDLAFQVKKMNYGDWAKFCLDLKDGVPSLCSLDLIRLDQKLELAFLEHIKNEGVIIYERD